MTAGSIELERHARDVDGLLGSGYLPAHKGSDVRRAIQAAGASLRYLPPYSPDLNPIENAFSKLKAILRKAAARTVDGLWDAIRDALRRFTPQDCASYFTAAGYEPERSDSALAACRVELGEVQATAGCPPFTRQVVG